MKETRSQFEKRVRLIVGNIKIDGLPNIFRSSLLCIKIAWLFILVGSSGCCFYFMVYSMIDYFKFQVNTSFRMITEIKAIYPAITLCDINAMHSTYYIDLLQQANLTYQLNSSLMAYENFLPLEHYMKTTSGRYFTLDEKQMMSDLDGMLVSCSIGSNPCNSSFFRYIFHPHYLNCYQFNSGYDNNGNTVDMLEASLAGYDNSIIFELYTGLPDILSAQAVTKGFYIFVANNTDYPLNKSPVPFRLTPGFALRVSSFRQFYSQYNAWPYAYSECTVSKDNELIKPLADTYLFDRVVETGYLYARETCLLFCYQHLTTQRCNCSNYWIGYQPPGYEFCFGEGKTCADNFYTTMFNEDTFVFDNCIAKCPLECHHNVFRNYQASFAYPDPLYVNTTLKTNTVLMEKYSNDTDFTINLASNMVQFEIFYDMLSYINVEEEPTITWEILMATLGGHLHLFLGMSLVSLIELIELAISLLLLLYFRVKKNLKVNSQNTLFFVINNKKISPIKF